MTNFSIHAPTGQSEKTIISANVNSSDGRTIGYPETFSVYVTKIATEDGSVSVTESRTLSEFKGNRLYLYHRPSVTSAGSAVSITASDGTIDTTSTNPTEGYVVFSSLPAGNFTVTYIAAPDCLSAWHLNTLQDDVMEIQQVLGVTSLTGYPGLKNLAYGLFDTPLDPNLSGTAPRAVYFGHLDQDIVIGSTTEASLTGAYGVNHQIQLGTSQDTVLADVTGFTVANSNGSRNVVVTLGDKTGDQVNISGATLIAFPLTVGTAAYPGYSGSLASITGSYYSGCVGRFNGDVAVLGDLQTVGSITVVNATGELSTVIGDFTVTDEFTVNGASTFYGLVTANNVIINDTLTINGDIVAGNSNGAGGAGQSLVDNLDCSEVAHTYNTTMRRVVPHSVLNGRPYLNQYSPKNSIYTFAGQLDEDDLVGDMWTWSGFATATAGPSGVHPNIIQVNFTSNPLPKSGETNGVWCEGLMDPGSLHITDLDTGFTSPIYGYTIESGDSTNVYKLNVFCPILQDVNRVQTNDTLLLYNKGSRPYNYLTFTQGASVNCTIEASAAYPLEIAFDNEVRKATTTDSVSVTSALEASITGLSTPATGHAFIIANAYSDPEAPPVYSARSVPYTLDKEVAIGEVTALKSGSSWTVLEGTSYRPGNSYDSSWIPFHANSTGVSGRAVPSISTDSRVVFFNHNLGTHDILNTSIDLYLGNTPSSLPVAWDQAMPQSRSIQGSSLRTNFGFDGGFTRVPLTNTKLNSADTERDASICYYDGRLIGIELNPSLENAITGSTDFEYMRLTIRRDA